MKKVKKEIVSSPEKSPEEDNENISWSHHLSESADVDKIKVKKEILSGHRNKRNGGEGDRDGESCFMRMDFHLAKQYVFIGWFDRKSQYCITVMALAL